MNALEIKQLQKIYPNGLEALKKIDFTVAKGDFFALLGPNGAGKTTLIGIVTSLVNKTTGKVAVFGDDLDTDPAKVKAHIGLVPQEFNFSIFEKAQDILMTQAGYYGIPRQLALQRSEKYLKQLELWPQRRSQVRMLSGGMKRRLMIARALMHEPELLILDEPTAGVDIEIRRSMWKFLREINAAGTTIVLTTHYLEEAESLCRNIAIIDHGEIVKNTTIQELLASSQLETFVLNLAEPISDVPNLSGFEVRQLDAVCLEVDVVKGHSLNDLFAELSQQHIIVNSMRNKVNRLEELFVQLTMKENADAES